MRGVIAIAVFLGLHPIIEAQTPSFTLSSTSLSFNANAGTSPSSQTVTLTNKTASPLSFTLSASTQSGGNWLSASAAPNPAPAQGTSTITVSVSSSQLQPGTYTGSVKVTAGTTTATITVTLTINGVSITASPNSITISSLQRGAQQSTAVHIGSGPANVQIAAAANQSGNWLSVDSSSVSAPGNFNVIVDATSINPGSYSGTITLQCVNGSPCIPITIPVNVTVAPAPLTIGCPAQTGAVASACALPQANVGSSYSVTLTASGGTPPYTWSATGLPSGLTLNSTTGVISGTPNIVGNFSFSVLVMDKAGASATRTFSLSVVGTPTLMVSPLTLNFTAQAGQKSQPQSVHIVVGSLTASVKMDASYDKGTGWLSPTPLLPTLDYNVSADATSLAAGTYTAVLTVACAGQTCNPSAVPIKVTFTVSPASQSKLLANPAALDLQGYQGRVNPAGKVSLTTDDGAALAFTITSQPPWVQISPTSGAASSNPAVLTVTPNTTGLSLGPNTGSITITPASGSPIGIDIKVTVSPFSIAATPNPPPVVTLGPGMMQDIPLNISTADTLPQNVAVTIRTASGGSNWLKFPLAGIQAPGLAKVTIDTAGLTNGTYTGSVTFSCSLTSSSDAACSQVQVPITLNVTSGPSTPTIRNVISASGFGAFPTIAPGTYIEIYGTNLSTAPDPGRTWAGPDFTNNGKTAPTSLGGTTVTVGGQNAFVYYISAGQVNALVPSNVGTGVSTITLTSPAGTTAPYPITINPVQPGFLAPPSFQIGGKQYVAGLLDAQTFTLPTGAIPGVSSRPAKPGETIVIYGVGFGPVNPQIDAGNVVSQSNSLTMPLQVFFGNAPAQLAYSGLGPNFTGLYQFNVLVPQVPDNDAVPLTFNLGGVNGAQTLYIAVRR